jgi:hypothetical protein
MRSVEGARAFVCCTVVRVARRTRRIRQIACKVLRHLICRVTAVPAENTLETACQPRELCALRCLEPAFVRSRSMALSNFAKAPVICIIIRPTGVVVSIASVRPRQPAWDSASRFHDRQNVAQRARLADRGEEPCDTAATPRRCRLFKVHPATASRLLARRAYTKQRAKSCVNNSQSDSTAELWRRGTGGAYGGRTRRFERMAYATSTLSSTTRPSNRRTVRSANLA